MTAFTVESVVSQEEWSGNRGQMITYELMLAGQGQTVQLIRQAKSQAPSPGDTLDGSIEQGSKGPKLKLSYDGPPGGAQASFGGASSNGGGRDDATGQSIERQVAAKAAAEMAVAAGGDAPTLIANFEAYFDIVATKIAGRPVLEATDAS